MFNRRSAFSNTWTLAKNQYEDQYRPISGPISGPRSSPISTNIITNIRLKTWSLKFSILLKIFNNIEQPIFFNPGIDFFQYRTLRGSGSHAIPLDSLATARCNHNPNLSNRREGPLRPAIQTSDPGLLQHGQEDAHRGPGDQGQARMHAGINGMGHGYPRRTTGPTA